MTRRTATHARRQPGRPASNQAAPGPAPLLAAASRLFAQHGIAGVSLRQLAKEAGVTSAMVHYYFGSKEGLCDALLDRALTRVAQSARATLDQGGGLDELLDLLVGTFASEPWIPTLVVREVLSEGGRYREQFIKGYATQMAEMLPALVRREIAAGRFRKDLDPKLAFLSLMGMVVMPFVARPVASSVLGIDYDRDFLRRFTQHTKRLFLEGVCA